MRFPEGIETKTEISRGRLFKTGLQLVKIAASPAGHLEDGEAFLKLLASYPEVAGAFPRRVKEVNYVHPNRLILLVKLARDVVRKPRTHGGRKLPGREGNV